MRLLARFAFLGLFAPCFLAHADTLSTFSIHGSSLFYGMGGDNNTIDGNATIDTTTGLVQAISFTAGGVYESGVDAQYGTVLFVGSSAAKFTVSGVTLVNFAGDNFNLNGPNDLYVGQLNLTGSYDPVATAVTSEPGSLLLLSTGILGIAVLNRRRLAW